VPDSPTTTPWPLDEVPAGTPRGGTAPPRPGISRILLDQPVWVKLSAIVLAALLALGLCFLTMTVENGHAHADQERLADVQRASSLVLQLERNAVDLKATAMQAVLRGGTHSSATSDTRALDTWVAAADRHLSELRTVPLSGEPKSSVERISTVFTEYTQVVRRFIDSAAADPRVARDGWEQIEVDNYLTSAVSANERELFDRAIDQAQASADASRRRASQAVLVTVVLAALVLVLLARLVLSSIIDPLRRVRHVLSRVAEGDLTVSCGVASGDELGQMARALDQVLGGLRETITSVARSADEMATSSGRMDTVSGELTSTADSASKQTQQVATSADDMSQSAESISGATQEMIASISEISRQALSASSVAAEAVHTVAETSRAVEALDVASQEIGEIIQTITSIAEQTNLLALNATIEAARAGAAGAGFAVVASEVKDLAGETARATDDITGKISAIQQTTEEAITTIGRISAVIKDINEKQTTIASAVEQQTTVTQEMSEHIVHISSGTAQVATTIGEISDGTLATTRAAMTTAESATDLAALSSQTRSLLSRFRY
jgi:methyl-accepting chemotaxis protein